MKFVIRMFTLSLIVPKILAFPALVHGHIDLIPGCHTIWEDRLLSSLRGQKTLFLLAELSSLKSVNMSVKSGQFTTTDRGWVIAQLEATNINKFRDNNWVKCSQADWCRTCNELYVGAVNSITNVCDGATAASKQTNKTVQWHDQTHRHTSCHLCEAQIQADIDIENYQQCWCTVHSDRRQLQIHTRPHLQQPASQSVIHIQCH